MGKTGNGFCGVVRFYFQHALEGAEWERIKELLNRKIREYNRSLDRACREGESPYRLPGRRIRQVTEENAPVWLEMKNYVMCKLEPTIFYEPFLNNVTKSSSHVKFEMTNHICKSAYFSYVSKGYETVREYMLYHHLMEL